MRPEREPLTPDRLKPAHRRMFAKCGPAAQQELRELRAQLGELRAQLCKELQAEGWSTREIAELFGHRSHTRVMRWARGETT